MTDHAAPVEGTYAAVRRLIAHIGDDPDRPGLADTPRRVVGALEELATPSGKGPAELLSVVFDEPDADAMVTVGPVPFTSLCEHHLLPFAGHAYLAYIPHGGQVVGLSKLPRLLDWHARRLQLQERIGAGIVADLVHHLSPDAAVVLDGQHSCMTLRGVGKPGAWMRTTTLAGAFRDGPEVRAEFLAMVGPVGAGRGIQ